MADPAFKTQGSGEEEAPDTLRMPVAEEAPDSGKREITEKRAEIEGVMAANDNGPETQGMKKAEASAGGPPSWLEERVNNENEGNPEDQKLTLKQLAEREEEETSDGAKTLDSAKLAAFIPTESKAPESVEPPTVPLPETKPSQSEEEGVPPTLDMQEPEVEEEVPPTISQAPAQMEAPVEEKPEKKKGFFARLLGR